MAVWTDGARRERFSVEAGGALSRSDALGQLLLFHPCNRPTRRGWCRPALLLHAVRGPGLSGVGSGLRGAHGETVHLPVPGRHSVAYSEALLWERAPGR